MTYVISDIHGDFERYEKMLDIINFDEERDVLFRTLKETLMDINTLPRDNPDHFFLPLARFFDRADLRRHEMDIFMGICRQMARLSAIAEEKKSGE